MRSCSMPIRMTQAGLCQWMGSSIGIRSMKPHTPIPHMAAVVTQLCHRGPVVVGLVQIVPAHLVHPRWRPGPRCGVEPALDEAGRQQLVDEGGGVAVVEDERVAQGIALLNQARSSAGSRTASRRDRRSGRSRRGSSRRFCSGSSPVKSRVRVGQLAGVANGWLAWVTLGLLVGMRRWVLCTFRYHYWLNGAVRQPKSAASVSSGTMFGVVSFTNYGGITLNNGLSMV